MAVLLAACGQTSPPSAVGITDPASGVPAPVTELLQKYVKAMEERDVFGLLALAQPGSQLFDDLLDSERFDRVRQSLVTVSDIHVRRDDADPDVLVVRFQKDQEDVFWTGTVSRGVGPIEMRLRSTAERLYLVGHRLAAADDTYLPGDPRTWKDEHAPTERALHMGVRLLQEGDTAGALAHLQDAITRLSAPDAGGLRYRTGNFRFVAQAHYYAAVGHLKAGDGEAARTAVDAALAVHPEFPLALALKGDMAVERGDVTTALEAWRLAVEADPDLSEVANRLDFFDGALRFFPDAERRQAYLSIRGEPADKAIRTLQKLLREDPANPELHRRLAIAYLQNLQPDKAEKVLQENDYLHPHDIETAYLLGRTSLALKRYDDALAMFAKVWHRRPGYRDTLVFLSEINAMLRRYQNAVVYLQDGLQRSPRSAELHFKIGAYLMKMGRRAEAERYLNRCTELQPPARLRRALRDLVLGV